MMTSCKGQTREPVVRPATQADRFYTGDPKELSEEVDSLLSMHNSQCIMLNSPLGSMHNNVAAIIVPHAGYYFSGNVAASAYMTLDTKTPYKRIFLLGPPPSIARPTITPRLWDK